MVKQQQVKTSPAQRKQELIDQLSSSRGEITHLQKAIKGNLNPKNQVRGLISKHPVGSVVGAASLGLLITSLFRRKAKSKSQKFLNSNLSSKKGLMMTLLGWGFTLAKPGIKSWLIKKATTMASQRIQTRDRGAIRLIPDSQISHLPPRAPQQQEFRNSEEGNLFDTPTD